MFDIRMARMTDIDVMDIIVVRYIHEIEIYNIQHASFTRCLFVVCGILVDFFTKISSYICLDEHHCSRVDKS